MKDHCDYYLFAATPSEIPALLTSSTLTDPTLMISLAFVEANYEILKSLLRDSRRTGSKADTRRNTKGNRSSEVEAEENGRREMNLPLLLAAQLGRNENGQPLQSSLTSIHGSH
ncbi:hypothetical protein Tco_0500751 [Tanacetum coccineum]